MEELTCTFNRNILQEFDSRCMSFYIAKLLGLAILGGSVALKLPQIWNIVSTKDVFGLSPLAFYSEVPLFAVSVVYNLRQGNPFTSYGENCTILVQNIILVVLLWTYSKPPPRSATMIQVVMCGLFLIVAICMVPDKYLFVLPLLNLPLSLSSRVPQIVSNFRLRSTGQLSIITTLLLFGGNVARVFTTIQEVRR
jgi:mannose-P-dolichol utilization defect protein 1